MADDDAGILLSELRHVVADLQRVVGRPVSEVWVPTPTSVVLDLGRDSLLYVASWPLPRLHTVERRPGNPSTPYSFQGLLRARLHGVVERLAIVGDDRVVELVVSGRTLHMRLFGRGGGIWLLEDGAVVASSEGPAPPDLPALPPAPPQDRPPRFEPVDGSWDLGARAYLQALAAADGIARRRRAVRGHLTRELRKARQLVHHLQGDLARADDTDALRHRADCLAAALHTVPRGASEVEVPDLADPATTVRVALDPAQPASASLTRMYAKAGRLERAAEQILERLDAAERRVDTLAAARATVDDADPRALRELVRTWKVPEATGPRRAAAAVAPWWTWTGPHGEQVWAGRHDTGNHALTFRRARGRDWWLHVRERPGAHVVIPVDKGQAPPLELLLAAAQVALASSRVAEGDTVDVQYTRVADLKAVKGGRPGQVIVERERVLHVTRDDAVLAGWTRS